MLLRLIPLRQTEVVNELGLKEIRGYGDFCRRCVNPILAYTLNFICDDTNYIASFLLLSSDDRFVSSSL